MTDCKQQFPPKYTNSAQLMFSSSSKTHTGQWILTGHSEETCPPLDRFLDKSIYLAGLQEAHTDPPKPEMQGQDLQLLLTA